MEKEVCEGLLGSVDVGAVDAVGIEALGSVDALAFIGMLGHPRLLLGLDWSMKRIVITTILVVPRVEILDHASHHVSVPPVNFELV